jgi:hypothetical protein
MSQMGKHSTFTVLHKWLLAGFAILGFLLTPLAFLVMFLTVNDLLGPYMDGWAWVVPLGTEVGFMGLFLADILLEAKGVPAAVLHMMPYLFAALSLWLNVEAARGHVVGMVGHSVLPLVFFGYLLAAKLLAKRLSVSTSERQRRTDVSDALAHARDILRAADRWWRFRAPVLLRRQIRSGRLPAAVLEAIDQGGASRWEPVLESWITRSLALPEGVAAQLAAAREAASQVTLAATPEVTPELPAQVNPEAVPGHAPSQPEVTPAATPQVRPRRKPAARPARISDADLKREIKAEFDADPSVSVNAAAKKLGRSRDRIRPLLEQVRAEANVRTLERKKA